MKANRKALRWGLGRISCKYEEQDTVMVVDLLTPIEGDVSGAMHFCGEVFFLQFEDDAGQFWEWISLGSYDITAPLDLLQTRPASAQSNAAQ